MKIKPFKLERYLSELEFSVEYLLSSSDCDGWPLSEILELADDESRKLWENLCLGYTEAPGLPILRDEISKLHDGVSPGDVLVLAPVEGIFIAMNCILEEGDHVICTCPAYQALYELANSLGCDVTKWMPDEDRGWMFDVDFLTENIRPNTKLIVVNFPHNPTGYLPSGEDFQKIMKIAKERGIFVFSDEMYRLLELDAKDRLPSAVDIYDNAVVLSGMSKTFGMAGVRIGWLATKNKGLYEKMASFKDYTTLCSSAPSEVLSLIALRAKDAILKRHIARIERNLDILDVFFEKHSKMFCWVRPKAGTVSLPRLLTDEGSFDFCECARKDAGVLLVPSRLFEFGEKHFRLTFGRENMPEALGKFEEYLRNQGGIET